MTNLLDTDVRQMATRFSLIDSQISLIETTMRRNPLVRPSMFLQAIAGLLLSIGCFTSVHSQEQPSKPTPIKIADDPKAVDPASLIPNPLTVPITVKFEGDPLKSVFDWIAREQKINLLVDNRALAAAKLLDSEPVVEALNNEPFYLLLNRLKSLGLYWYMQDGSLSITSQAKKHETTMQYNLGDLLDTGFTPYELYFTIKSCSGGNWDNEETASATILGDVLFVRQSDDVQMEVAGLLAALRNHGRRTLTLDVPQNEALRAALDKKVTVDFEETPLVVALQDLSAQAQISIRLESKGAVRERTPVSLKVEEQKLSTVLQSLISNLGLSWHLKDGVMWIAGPDAAGLYNKTAVFDVRDLCRDQEEAKALKETIRNQFRSKQRPPVETPKTGVLVIRGSEQMLDEVLQLLGQYRAALSVSKLRLPKVETLDPKEFVTGYYRLPKPMAEDLLTRLPLIIQPNSWKSTERPVERGTISEISTDSRGPANATAARPTSENLVLVIHQSRAAHQEIGKLIQTLLDARPVDVQATAETNAKPTRPTGTFGSLLLEGAGKE